MTLESSRQGTHTFGDVGVDTSEGRKFGNESTMKYPSGVTEDSSLGSNEGGEGSMNRRKLVM